MKSRKIILACLITGLTLPPSCSAQQKLADIASHFLLPGTRLESINRFDPKTGKPIERAAAAFSGHFLSPDSDDIVFAYVNTAREPEAKCLFLTVLHGISGRYTVVFQKSYYERFLWVQDFSTIGLKILRLPGQSGDSIAITTARGASLGAQVEVYHWEPGIGMTNLMPAHPPAHQVSYIIEKDQFQLKLSFEKYPGEKSIPPPITYVWDGHQLVQRTS